MRFGLCCLFRKAAIKFRRTTAAAQAKRSPQERRRLLAELCRHNAARLAEALSFCHANGIGAFRINSQILPLITHPQQGYRIADLPKYRSIVDAYRQCGEFARRHDIRTSFHPDQFVVIASPRPQVRRKSLAELAYQNRVAEWVAADVINIHAGGAYGNKHKSLKRLVRVINGLPDSIKSRLTLENDDRTYSPADLLPLCKQTGVPLVYDVHHHRCLPDHLTIADATTAALKTWHREPLFHLSSPREVSHTATIDRRHADYIDVADFPPVWRDITLTIEIEAKAKELAVLKLMQDLQSAASGQAHQL